MSMWVKSPGLSLIATHRFGRLQGLERAEPEALEHTADRGRRDAGLLGDLLAGHALAAQRLDPGGRCGRRGPVQAMRPGAAIQQAGFAFGVEARDPFADGLGAQPEGRRHRRRALPLLHHTPLQFGSTVRRRPGILMDVHSVPPRNH